CRRTRRNLPEDSEKSRDPCLCKASTRPGYLCGLRPAQANGRDSASDGIADAVVPLALEPWHGSSTRTVLGRSLRFSQRIRPWCSCTIPGENIRPCVWLCSPQCVADDCALL